LLNLLGPTLTASGFDAACLTVAACRRRLAGVNLEHIKKHRRDFTGVSWWGTAFIRNDTTGTPAFIYNSTYAVGEAMLQKETPEIDLFPVLEADPPLMAAAATQAAAAAKAHGWAGFNVDYEPGGMWSAPEFACFLANLRPLALALHAVGLELSVDICCISQVANFAEQIAGSAVDRWVPMDTYNDDLPSFLNDLDIYQRFVPSNNLAPGLFPTGPPGWNNDTGSGHTQAVERFGLLQRSGAQHVALFCLDPDSNAAWEADHWWDLSRKFLDDCGGCYVGTCWTNMTC